MTNYICMKCGQETNNPHFDLVSGVVRCPTCLEQESGLLGKLRGMEENESTDHPRS
ncbi:MAG: hypothetical protein GX354_06335 [Firmicutes bacterium]|jgi:uncharacterized Zn finger protein (UPF0148 family)|nr:hypothetical protein [Bacillota bacterium]